MGLGAWAVLVGVGGLLGGLGGVCGAELIELSYTYGVDAPTSPKLKAFEYTIEKIGTGILGPGVWVYMNEFCTSEHSGTHVDAPLHFVQDRWAIDAIPLERIWRVPGVMIDLSEKIRASGETNYAVSPGDLEEWEQRYGTIPDGAAVFLRTGWGMKVHDLALYSGIDENKKNNFPGLSTEAAEWLVGHGERHNQSTGVVGVGVDTISVDVGNSTQYIAHRTMYAHNIYGMENVANLHKLPATGFLVTVMPMRLGGGSGAPTRIIAEVKRRPQPHHRRGAVSDGGIVDGQHTYQASCATPYTSSVTCVFVMLATLLRIR